MIEPVASSGLLGTFGVNGKLFLAQLINFGIVLLVMWKWVYTPLVAIMERRSKEIADGLAHAKEAERHLADARLEHDRILRDVKKEAVIILEDTRKKEQGIKEERMTLAKQEIEKLVAEAKQRIQNERDETFRTLQNECAALIALATQKIAGNMSESAQRAQIAKAITELQKV